MLRTSEWTAETGNQRGLVAVSALHICSYPSDRPLHAEKHPRSKVLFQTVCSAVCSNREIRLHCNVWQWHRMSSSITAECLVARVQSLTPISGAPQRT